MIWECCAKDHLNLGVVYNVFEAVDVIALIRGGVYDDLSLTVGEVLKKRSPVCCKHSSMSLERTDPIGRNSRASTPAR